MPDTTSVVLGAGGFIGGHLVHRLLEDGRDVRAVDVKPIRDWWQDHGEHATSGSLVRLGKMDLRDHATTRAVIADALRGRGRVEVYHLAANMGGIGFITQERGRIPCCLNSLITLNVARFVTEDMDPDDAGRVTITYSSSACAYPTYAQSRPDDPPLHESQVHPAMPELGYGEEKLFSERVMLYLRHHGVRTRVARIHNCYGPRGSWRDGREKAPAALCRKVAEAPDRGEIVVWGVGSTTRSFMWVGDCVEGLVQMTMHLTDDLPPLNLGSEERVTILELAAMIINISGKQLSIRFDASRPVGVSGRCSDNSKIRTLLNWEPSTLLKDGLRDTYEWVRDQVGIARVELEEGMLSE